MNNPKFNCPATLSKQDQENLLQGFPKFQKTSLISLKHKPFSCSLSLNGLTTFVVKKRKAKIFEIFRKFLCLVHLIFLSMWTQKLLPKRARKYGINVVTKEDPFQEVFFQNSYCSVMHAGVGGCRVITYVLNTIYCAPFHKFSVYTGGIVSSGTTWKTKKCQRSFQGTNNLAKIYSRVLTISLSIHQK